MSDRKKPSAAFWITVALIAVLLGYPLSIGPVIWLVDGQMLSERAAEPVAIFYFPLMWTVGTSEATATAYAWYARMWMRARDSSPPP